MGNQTFLKFIDINFDFFNKEVIPQIEKEYLRVGAIEIVERVKATVIAFADGAFTKAELIKVWENLPSDPDVIAALKQVIIEFISKIEEKEVSEGLSLLVNPIIKSIVILTDKQEYNKELLGQTWKEFLNSVELLVYGLSHLEWFLKRFIKDETIVKWLMKVIKVFTTK